MSVVIGERKLPPEPKNLAVVATTTTNDHGHDRDHTMALIIRAINITHIRKDAGKEDKAMRRTVLRFGQGSCANSSSTSSSQQDSANSRSTRIVAAAAAAAAAAPPAH